MFNLNLLAKKYINTVIATFVLFCAISTCFASEDLISLFPLKHYDQNISTWIKPSDTDFDKPLMDANVQQQRFEIFLDHYVGSHSPWNADYVKHIINQNSPNDLKSTEKTIIDNYNNEGKSNNEIGYGENFRPYGKKWISDIAENINISQLDGLTYQADNRAIAVENLEARALPTNDVHFYHHTLAGQGYPFDNLQISALWAGTPVYIVAESSDHAWLLVITTDYIGWVQSKGIARVDNSFINSWSEAAKHKLVAITRTRTSLTDAKGKFLLLAYVGSVFPGEIYNSNLQIMVPTADAEGFAVIKYATISNNDAVAMPLTATPQNFSMVMNTLLGRPYGWGGMYFYNDCSAELKNLLTPFGIWLPRHSADQVTVGKMVDMTSSTPEKRLEYLTQHGQRFLTLIYIGSHIIMYIGNYPNPNKHDASMAMTYQNVWGLSPSPPVRRAVIGKSVLFPMLLQYPEDTSLTSLAAKKFFQVSYLNQFPSNTRAAVQSDVDLKSLMYPDPLLN